jgi:hypothetical protein
MATPEQAAAAEAEPVRVSKSILDSRMVQLALWGALLVSGTVITGGVLGYVPWTFMSKWYIALGLLADLGLWMRAKGLKARMHEEGHHDRERLVVPTDAAPAY